MRHIPSRTLLLALAALAAPLAAASRPVAAQAVAGGGRAQSAEERARRRAETARAVKEAVERARARLNEVRVGEDDPEAHRAILAVDAALRAAYTDQARAAVELQRAQELARPQISVVFDDALFKRSLKEAASLQRELLLDRVQVRRVPRGYLGISYSSTRTVRIENGQEVMKHHEYPKLLSVEPGSPAEAAGLRRDDVILAYDGHDLKDPVPVSEVLVPGKVVNVRLRRDGRTQEIPVRVGTRTESFVRIGAEGCGDCTRVLAPMPPMPAMPPTSRTPAMPRAAPVAEPRERAISGTVIEPPLIIAPSAIGATMIAGAEFRRVDSDMREELDVSRGAVVLRVVRGSPAHKSGLRFLDVVTRADGRAVSSGTDLFRVLEAAVERDRNVVVLEVVRDRRKREVKLAW